MAEESLIPKKPTVKIPYEGGFFGVFFRLSFAFFIVAAILTGGLYLYRNFLINNLADQKATLQKLETDFEPALISELDKVSSSITNSKDLLKNHTKTSEVFAILEENTLPEISFGSFGYNTELKSLSLQGEAFSYSAISLQSSVFESLPSISSAKFSNLGLKDSGKVTFNLTIIFK